MPELPEIEAIRKYLIQSVSNEVITEVKAFQHTVIRSPSVKDFEDLLKGATLDNIERTGKILQFFFHKSDLQLHLYLDHGLTGRLAWYSSSRKLPVKTVFQLKFSNNRTLLYHDLRLHGAIWLFFRKNDQPNDLPIIMTGFGPDILNISENDFISRLQRFNGEIKGVLTNQKFVTGIGNAYADEILFEAKIHPFNRRPMLNNEEKTKLYHTSRAILENSVKKISLMLNETQKLDNERYWRQEIFRIHLKDKQPCPVCKKPISTIKTKRYTNFCRNCQIPKNRNFI